MHSPDNSPGSSAWGEIEVPTVDGKALLKIPSGLNRVRSFGFASEARRVCAPAGFEAISLLK